MGSKYAYVHFVKDINAEEVTKGGKIVQFNVPMRKGQTDLVSIAEYRMLERDFPDCVKGKEIEDKNLLNMVKYCYDALKEDIKGLSKVSGDVKRRLEYLASEFERSGVLTPDHQDQSSIEDLANKVTLLQHAVRENQYADTKNNQSHK